MREERKIQCIREYVEIEEKIEVIRCYDSFFTEFRRLFDYCSTKENLPNKLLSKLKISVSAVVNDKMRVSDKKFVLHSDNYSSHVLIKFEEVQ